MYYQKPSIDKIKKVNEVLNYSNPVWKDDINWLIESFEEAVKVIEFYGNKNNHEQKYRSPFNSEYYDSEVTLDYGEKARELLSKF